MVAYIFMEFEFSGLNPGRFSGPLSSHFDTVEAGVGAKSRLPFGTVEAEVSPIYHLIP